MKKSRRCPKCVTRFVREKLKINIESISENPEGELIFLEDESEINSVLQNNNIMKLLIMNSSKYTFNSMGWGNSKGDTFDETCVILTQDYSNINQDNFILPKKTSTNNKIYVAFTRAKNKVYVISKERFYVCKNRYLK